MATVYAALFFVVGVAFSGGFWLVLGVAFRFRATGRLRRLAWASALGPISIAAVLMVAEARAGISWAGLRTTGVLALAAALGGLVFWLVSRAVTRRVFQQQNT